MVEQDRQKGIIGRELGIAVIGAGRMGSQRAGIAAAHPAVRYLAVSDIDPSRARSVGERVNVPLVIVPYNSPWKTMTDMPKELKAKPNHYAFCSGGLYGGTHLPPSYSPTGRAWGVGLSVSFRVHPRQSRGFQGRNHLETISSTGMLAPFSFQNLTAPGWSGILIFARDSNLGPAVSQ